MPIGLTIVFALGLPGATGRLAAADIGEVKGTVTQCVAASGRVSLDVLSSGHSIHFDVEDDDVPRQSPAYRAVVATAYSRSGECPANGEQVRITQCIACAASAVVAVETGGRGARFDEAKRELWLIRQYFDRESSRPNQYVGVFAASMMLARYNRIDGGARSLWIRDRLSRALDGYSSVNRGSAMVSRFGRPEWLATVAPVSAVYGRYKDALGLVKGLPYMPSDPRSSPFVGAWGVFAAEVYVERGNGTLLKAYQLK